MTTVVKLEQRLSNAIRKVLCLHNSTTNIFLYSTSSPCPLPIESLTSVTKSAKLSEQLLLRGSKDHFVSSAFISGKFGCNKCCRQCSDNTEF